MNYYKALTVKTTMLGSEHMYMHTFAESLERARDIFEKETKEFDMKLVYVVKDTPTDKPNPDITLIHVLGPIKRE
jgi:hypothetical protein